MPGRQLKEREEVLQVFLKKVDADIDKFTQIQEKLEKQHENISDVILDAGLEPIPIRFSAGKGQDALQEVRNYVLELNKIKNLISMKLKRILQEEDLEEHLRDNVGKNVTFAYDEKGKMQVEVSDVFAQNAYETLQENRKKLDALRQQIHELGEDD